MKTITQEELAERLELHAQWTRGVKGGQPLDLSGMDLSRMDLSGANLSLADLSGANMRRANLTGANLGCANLFRAEMQHANLSGANMRRAKLSGADLGWANLSGAEMWHANLTGANMRRANLTHADLQDANLTDVNPPKGMRAGESLGYRWMLYGDGRFGFGCETHSISAWLDGGLAETLAQRWIGEGWEQFSAEIRRILEA